MNFQQVLEWMMDLNLGRSCGEDPRRWVASGKADEHHRGEPHRVMAKTPAYWEIGVSKNSATPKSSILKGFSIINHPFWGTTIFGNTQMNGTEEGPMRGNRGYWRLIYDFWQGDVTGASWLTGHLKHEKVTWLESILPYRLANLSAPKDQVL